MAKVAQKKTVTRRRDRKRRDNSCESKTWREDADCVGEVF